MLLDPISSLPIAIDTVCVMRMKYFLVLSWLLSQGNSFSIWEQRSRNIPNFRTSHHINHDKIIRSSTLLKANDQSESYDYNGFNDRLRKAYDEWCETYGDSIDESRMEIFSYHFVMAENYFKETGNRIKLNEYADLTAVEFQRLKEMGGMIQDVKQDGPHWAPEDAAQMDYFAKQTSQRQQAFQDNKKQVELPTPPPGYFSVLSVPDNASSSSSSSSETTATPPTAAPAPPTSESDPYEQRFTQDYLDELNTQAALAAAPNQQQPPPREGPELQDLINSRYDGIGFLEDSSMDSSSTDDDYKFMPALSKMYNLDYPERETEIPPPPPQIDSSNTFNNSEDKKETFMNAMSTLYSQMFGEDDGSADGSPSEDAMRMVESMIQERKRGPAGNNEAFRVVESFMQQASNNELTVNPSGSFFPALSMLYSYMSDIPQEDLADASEWQWASSSRDKEFSPPPPSIAAPIRESPPPLVEEMSMSEEDEDYVGTDVFLGELSYKMTRGRVIEWLKSVGDWVKQGEPLLVIESDTFMNIDGQKYAETHDVIAMEDGILAAIYTNPKETVPVGSILGVIAENEAEAAKVPLTFEQEQLDFIEPPAVDSFDDYAVDENGYPIDEYAVDENGYPINDYDVDENGYPIDDYGAGGDEAMGEDGYGQESAYAGPVDDDPDLPSWVRGDAPSIAPAKVASKYPVIPKMSRPSPPPQKRAPPRKKRAVPKGRYGANRPRGRIDDTRSPARKARQQRPKIEGTELKLNELAYGMTKGTVIEWIKGVGQSVKKGEPLAVVESDTFMMIDGQKYAESHDVIASEDGVLAAIYTTEKQTIPIGSLLGVIAENAAAANRVPQSNPYDTPIDDDPYGENSAPMSRTQRAAAAAVEASMDPVNRARASADSGYIDSVEQQEEDILMSQEDQYNDEFDRRFMTPEELENADFAAAGAETAYSGPQIDDPDLPSWVLGNAPSIAPAKVAAKYPVIPKVNKPPPQSRPGMPKVQNTGMVSDLPPPKRRAAPKGRFDDTRKRPRGRIDDTRRRPRGRIDDTRAPLAKEDEGTEIVLSELAYGMTKGMVIEWLKNVGDPVRKGEPLAVVESDTFMMVDRQKYAESHDIIATENGFLTAIYAGEKELMTVGSALGVISETASAPRRSPPRRGAPPRRNTPPNGSTGRTTYGESNGAGETYYPPPDPTEAEKPAWADDPDLPSWVRGDAPSIAPAKVAAKYPVIPNMRQQTGSQQTVSRPKAASPQPNGARRVPKGRFDDTRARPRPRGPPPKPKGGFMPINPPNFVEAQSGEPQFMPDLSGGEKEDKPETNTAPEAEEPKAESDNTDVEAEKPELFPDLSKSTEEETIKDTTEDTTEPDDVVLEDSNIDVDASDTDASNTELDSESNPVLEDDSNVDLSNEETENDEPVISSDETELEIKDEEVDLEPILEELDGNVTAEVEIEIPEELDETVAPTSQTVSTSSSKVSPKPNGDDGSAFEKATNSTSSETMVEELLVTSKARTAAEEAKIDLATITGTGDSGCITLDDVKLAIARKKPKIGAKVTSDTPKAKGFKKKP